MVYRQAKEGGSEIPKGVQAKLRLRFPNLADLLEFLNVKAVMMKNVRLVLKRVPANSCAWKLHTAYAANQEPQLRRIKVSDTSPPLAIDKTAYDEVLARPGARGV